MNIKKRKLLYMHLDSFNQMKKENQDFSIKTYVKTNIVEYASYFDIHVSHKFGDIKFPSLSAKTGITFLVQPSFQT